MKSAFSSEVRGAIAPCQGSIPWQEYVKEQNHSLPIQEAKREAQVSQSSSRAQSRILKTFS